MTKLFPILEGYEGDARLGRPDGRAAALAALCAVGPQTRTGWAGGYVGEGVAASNLAGRAMADLVTGRTRN